jgi:hypothetical protein
MEHVTQNIMHVSQADLEDLMLTICETLDEGDAPDLVMSLGINSSVPATMVSSYFDAPCIMLDVMSDNLQALSMVMSEHSTIVVCSGIDYNNNRHQALQYVSVIDTLSSVLEHIEKKEGKGVGISSSLNENRIHLPRYLPCLRFQFLLKLAHLLLSFFDFRLTFVSLWYI